jgi:soluble lytic murein transglycosylase-like protein
MTLTKRLRVGVMSLVATVSVAGSAAAAAPKALTDGDARAYAAAFQAVEEGDFVGAQLQAAQIHDKSLSGYLSFGALMHPSAHKASFDELCGWLSRFRDLPLAQRVFSLAARRKPADAEPPPVPQVAVADPAQADLTRPAREAYYSGDAETAFKLAVEVGERWIAGLAAWRLADYDHAQTYFAQVANDQEEDPWLRSAGAYWAARASVALGDAASANAFLRLAAQAPQTFYGMLASRQTQIAAAEAPTVRIIPAAYVAPAQDLAAFVRDDPRAHRAAALAQIGRIEEAHQELRAGLALAGSPDERQAWNALIAALSPAIGPRAERPQYATLGDYEVPALHPRSGFIMDRALVYAIVRQESRFNPRARSRAGALGLMQVLPSSAYLATGNRRFKTHPKLLFDPAINLEVGQDYLAYLMDRGVGSDLLRVVAAYNAGPGTVLKTAAMIGDDDPLLLIESLPALETRDYVEKVMAAYWSYKRLFGEQPRTLDALARGASHVDAALDLPDAPDAQPELAPQPLKIGAAASLQAASFD